MNHKQKDICGVKQVYRLTLCWSCANATGGCSWTARDPETGAITFKPVEGWKARKTTLKGYRHENTSYHVIKCPEYKEDE